ncbi:hypothetical protein COB72_09600 [bacterium]|nr:MAG: hypothetical protein COB72_09600 [bacterium]
MKHSSFINRRCKGTLAIAASTIALGLSSSASAQCDPGQVVRLFADDATLGDHYGVSVAISGNTAVVGAIDAQQPNGVATGSAYVYERIDGVWTFHTQLSPFDLAAGDQFGRSVAIDEHVIVVSAVADDDFGNDSGSVFVYQRFAGFWPQIAKLLAEDGQEDDLFGASVAVSGDTIIVGAPGSDQLSFNSGAAYIYNLVDFAWTPGVKLAPTDAESEDRFGTSVSIRGNIAAVGANGVGLSSSQGQGAAYMYSRPTGGAWVEQAKLVPTNVSNLAFFGSSVALGTDVVAIGAWNDNSVSIAAGSAFLFTTNDDGITWTEQAKIIANDSAVNNYFGEVSISEDDNTVVVGAYGNTSTSGVDSGAAYVFTRTGGTWIEREKIVPEGPTETLGFSVSIDDNTLIVGAANALLFHPPILGSAYIYGINCPPNLADLTGDGNLNFFDVSAFLYEFNLNRPIADFNMDGQWNFFDVSAFLAAFSAGSP